MEVDKKQLFLNAKYRIISNWNVHNNDLQMIDRGKRSWIIQK